MKRRLEDIETPEDLKKLSIDELRELCDELRREIVSVTSENGGHLAPSLGVVELTTAIHYVFDSPKDKILWDVGHQSYAHKILTGRRDRFATIRRRGGLSGFPSPGESEHDAYGAGHASTSISAALGFAAAKKALGHDYDVVTVTGDGAITGGLAYEGLNNAGSSKLDLLVVLNDNEMSISRNVGAVHHYLTSVTLNPLYNKMKEEIWEFLGKLPAMGTQVSQLATKIDEGIKGIIVPGSFFQTLGFRYFGPIDGHDLEELINVLTKLKKAKGPRLLHVLTKKGKGCSFAESKPVSFHGTGPFHISNGLSKRKKAVAYTDVFGKTAASLAERRKEIVAVTAAMTDGTGLSYFRDVAPDRLFDVGIAEGHAVCFAAGMASAGLRPIVAVYSTFLQRGVDQIIHDVALQKLPVVFCLDRAGIVGDDGATHQGTFDLSYLRLVPGMVIGAPKNGGELRDLLHTALAYTGGPFAIRYPKGTVPDEVDLEKTPESLEIGSWEVIRGGSRAALLATGSMVDCAEKAAALLAPELDLHVVNARFVKPLDEAMLEELGSAFEVILTLEENTVNGGFGSGVNEHFNASGAAGALRIHNLGIPDTFIEHGSRTLMLAELSLSPETLAERISTDFKLKRVKRKKRARSC